LKILSMAPTITILKNKQFIPLKIVVLITSSQ
jgi:hypothetical protein